MYLDSGQNMKKYLKLVIFIQCHLIQVFCLPQPDLLRGVVDIANNQHKLGGTLAPYLTSYFQCLEGCREDEDCIAADFDANIEACWFHNYTSACTASKPQEGVKHITLCDCTPGVSVGGGSLVTGYVEESECVKSCKKEPRCYGVDFNIRFQHCYHHYMDTICQAKKADPDTVHYSRVSCRSSPTASKIFPGHFVRGGTVNPVFFSEGDCTSACLYDDKCVGVDFYHGNHTCVMHSAETGCDPRFPLHGVTHFQFDNCSPYAASVETSFMGQVLDAAGLPLGMESALATDEFSCVDLCAMTTGCVSVDWDFANQKCYLHQADTGCNSVTKTPSVIHHELTDCTMSGELQAFFYGFHVRGGEYKPEFKTRDRCLSKCMQPDCSAADWNEKDRACYYHTNVTACNTLIKKDSCTHYKFTECVGPIRTVLSINNSSRAEGGTAVPGAASSSDCIEFCGDDENCTSVDYNVITHECIKHDLDESCRPLVTQADWYNFRLIDCSDVVPGAKNFTGMHVPGASRIQETETSEECYYLCKYLIPDCAAVDFNDDTKECYIHDNGTACEPLIAKESCTHYRLTDCKASIKSTHQNSMVPGGMTVVGPQTEIECFYNCREDPECTAFDFNTLQMECKIHHSETGCDQMVDATSWAHHKLFDCHEMPVSPVTDVTFDMHISAGMLISNVLPGPVACIDKCILAQASGTECFAVDFNFVDNECWFHNRTTACNPMEPKVGCAHYNLYDCDYPGHKRMVEVGSPQAQALNLEECIETCAAHSLCLGVDFAENVPSGLTCQFHYTDTACGVLIPDPIYTHYAFDDCKGQTVIAKSMMADSTLPGGTVQNVTSGTECVTRCTGDCLAVSYNPTSGACVRYNVSEACQTSTPSVGTTLFVFIDCTSSVGTSLISASYAGSRWAGGTLSETAMTKEECLEACADDGFCTAFSFNYRKGQCYLHTEVGCEPVIRSMDYQDFTVYIMKRAGCDTKDVVFANAYHGVHVNDGILAGQFTQTNCVLACSQDQACRAVDYNPVNFACWFHGAATCENQLVRDPRITHFVIKYC